MVYFLDEDFRLFQNRRIIFFETTNTSTFFYCFRDILLLEAGFLCLLVAPKRSARYVFVADLTVSERRGTSHGTKINFIITYTVYSSNRNLETK